MATEIWRTKCSHCGAAVPVTDATPSRDEPDGSTSYVAVCGKCDGRATYRRAVPANPVIWKVNCKGCDARLAVREDTPFEVGHDGATCYQLRCPKCSERSEYVKPRDKTDGEIRDANAATQVHVIAQIRWWLFFLRRAAWGFVTAIAAHQFYRYESVLRESNTVFQEISVSLTFLTEVTILFVASYSLAKVIDGMTAPADK